MTAVVITLGASVLSGLLLYCVGLGDPKRLRTLDAPRATPKFGKFARRVLVTLACAPGIGLAAAGWWGPFTVWLGGTLMLGWFAVLALNPERQEK